MANPMKKCESCKGAGKVVDFSKKGHAESGDRPALKTKKDMKQMPSSKPKNPPTERGKK